MSRGAGDDGQTRCGWCLLGGERMIRYHDLEWGVPEHDDRALFEKLVLDGAQAGLSWKTILDKREGYRRAFEGFDPERVAAYGEEDIERLLADPGIVRNRQKILSAVGNARAFLTVAAEHGSFERYLWGFVDGRPIVNHPRSEEEIPAESALSRRLSEDLRSRGFSFVGPVILYAYLQAVGVINDHLVSCFRHEEV